MSQLVRWGFDRASGAKARPVPLVRAVAYRGPWPIHSHRTMAEVMADEQAVVLAAKEEAGPRIKSGVTKLETKSRANARVDGGVGGTAPKERVSRPAAGRSAAATSELMDATAGETAPVADPVRAALPLPVSVPVAVAVSPVPPAPPVRETPALPRDARGKIILAAAPSGMEQAARQWIAPASLVCTTAVAPIPDEGGKVWCAGCDANVPRWFGRDCISTTCDLKASA